MVSTETHGITIPKGGPDNVRDYSFLRAENDWVLGCHGYAGDPLVALDALEDWLIDELNLPDEIIDIPNSEQKYEEDMVHSRIGSQIRSALVARIFIRYPRSCGKSGMEK
ncbi:hypothetical protein [Halalkalirubrum salinum]|uniref:hypothetical protein n=1 Tax=Halalkalirubrum salinum TaxID=2563889 RepID=UPI0010FB42E5|nr:hypothetical protein [Halalkalirubrum salinum]